MISENKLMKEELTDIVSEANRIAAWHKYNPKETIVDELIKSKVIISPAMPGDRLYKIRKVCNTNDGYKEEFKPNIEYYTACKHLDPQSWYDDCDQCKATDWEEGQYPDLNLKIFCEECKNRFCIQRTEFQWSDMTKVVNTAMFDESTDLYDRRYLTENEAINALEEILNEI